MLIFTKRIMRWINKKLAICFLLLLIGLALGALANRGYTDYRHHKMQTKYNLLSSRVANTRLNQPIISFNELKTKIGGYYYSHLRNLKTSVYFEYLPTGTSIGFNENQEMIGASLLKLPVAMNLYKLAEEKKVNLDEKITIKPEWLNDFSGNLFKKGAGYQISLRDLTAIMLKDSDNTAEVAVFETMKNRLSLETFFDFIDLDYKINKDDTLQIGSHSYSSILKCLYFACYINKDHSQELLKFLTESSFKRRLLLYINDDVTLANKWGIFLDKVQSYCVIFYLPNNNYILCVMVEGEDKIASRHIGNISQITYEYMKKVSNQSSDGRN